MQKYHPIKVRRRTGILLSALKEVTKLSKAELTGQSLELLFQQLPRDKKYEVSKIILSVGDMRGLSRKD